MARVMRHGCVRRNLLFFESSPGFGGSVGSLGHLLRQLDAERYHAYCVVSHPAHHAFLKSCVPAVPILIDKAHTLTTRHGMGGWLATPFHVFGKPGRRVCYAIMCFVNWLGPVHAFARRIQSMFPETKFDAVWLNNGPGNGFGVGALLARRWQVPLFCKVQGFQRNNPVTRWLAHSIDYFLPDSEAVAASLRALGVPDERIIVTYCPVDTAKYDPARELPTGEFRRGGDVGDTPTFGILGMLQEWKGQHVFLHAAKKVLDRVPNSVAVIVGDAPDGSAEYRAYLKNLARELGIAERVVFTGYRQDIPAVMADLDVVVHASIQPEPFGTVVAEAMAMERGVVAARAGGPAEYVEHGVNGFLTTPSDPEDMASAIITLLMNSGLRARMGRRARRTVVERFSANILARKTEEIIETVIGLPHRSLC